MQTPSLNNSLTAARNASSNSNSNSNEQRTLSQSVQDVCVEDTMILSFVNMLTQFLEAMAEVFPECPRVSMYLAGWKGALLSGSDTRVHYITVGKGGGRKLYPKHVALFYTVFGT